MYILTSRLVSLTDRSLPLPWYHRAPLGLMSGTPVHVALQAPRSRPFGDIIVSVVDPVNWPDVYEVSASRVDEAGLLAGVYRHAPPLNIVFAEAITVDSGSRHDARLVLEPFQQGRKNKGPNKRHAEQIARVKRKLEGDRFEVSSPRQLHPEQEEFVWMDVGRVELGWVEVEGWREAVERQAEESEGSDVYDLNMAVVSADSNRRLLRYVFPRKGAVSISIEHADSPGVMSEIAGALAATDLNVLSSLLRRGSAPHSKAEVVVVVEPENDCTDPIEVRDRAHDALDALEPALRVRVNDIDVADPPAAVLYPRRPHEIAARPAKPLEATIRAVREMYPADRRLIFISRRFAADDEAENDDLVETLRQAIRDNGFVPVEALPQPGAQGGVSDEVRAKMWASDAAIMFVISIPDEDHTFSQNLAHECGFMQGQAKPLLPLVQKEMLPSIVQNANLQGLQLTTFSRARATDHGRPDSISSRVTHWLSMLREAQGWKEGAAAVDEDDPDEGSPAAPCHP